MSDMSKWVVVKSRSKKDRDGFPLGEFLCRDGFDARQLIEDLKIEDPVAEKYLGLYAEMSLSDQLRAFEDLQRKIRGIDYPHFALRSDLLHLRVHLDNIIAHLRYLASVERADESAAED